MGRIARSLPPRVLCAPTGSDVVGAPSCGSYESLSPSPCIHTYIYIYTYMYIDISACMSACACSRSKVESQSQREAKPLQRDHLRSTLALLLLSPERGQVHGEDHLRLARHLYKEVVVITEVILWIPLNAKQEISTDSQKW